ncbi:MAG: MoaD/ThiS family protein [Burkholderiales bacterium]
MKVHIPNALRSYAQTAEVEAQGTTLDELLRDLDRRFPGIRFRMIDEQDRIRRHIRIFIDGEQSHSLTRTLDHAREVVIVQALSGG